MKLELPLDSNLIYNVVRCLDDGQTVLISSSNQDGTIKNILPCSWMTAVTYKGPLYLISISKPWFSHKLIKESKEFVINVPRTDLKEQVLQAGSMHGDQVNKIEKLKLTPLKAKTVKAPLLKECFLNIECHVFKEIDVPGATVFLAKTTVIHYDEGVITEKGFNEDYKGKHNFVYYTDVRSERV